MRRGLASLAIAATFVFSGNTQAQFAACTIQNRSLTDAGTDPFNFTRLAVRQDGRPLIVYTSDVHNDSSLYVYDCDNPLCSSGHPVQLDTSTNYFGAPGIVIRSSGLPAIVASYFGGLRFYDCADTDCATVTNTDLRDQNNAILADDPVALQTNGNPAILYVDGSVTDRPGSLILRFCADVGCVAAGTETVLAVPPAQSEFSGLSLAFGSDGAPAATYLTSEGASNLNVYDIARCSDAVCTTVTNTQISAPTGTSIPTRSSLAIRSTLFPLALDSQSQNRALLDCANVGCTAANSALLPSSAVGTPVGLKLMADDRPAFGLFSSLSVGAYACATSACLTGAGVQIASAATDIRDADFALDNVSSPAMAYIDISTNVLGVARCYNADEIFADGFDVVH